MRIEAILIGTLVVLIALLMIMTSGCTSKTGFPVPPPPYCEVNNA